MAVLPALAIAATALSTGVGILGSVESARAQSESAAYSAQVARTNETIAQQTAAAALQAGEANATAQSLRSRAILGQAIAGEAASGIDPYTGSAADVNITNRELGALNTAQTLNNAQLQAYGYRTQATSFGAQAGLEQAQSEQATQAGAIGAVGSLASGAASLGSKWAVFQAAGVPGFGGTGSPTPAGPYDGSFVPTT